MNDPELQELWLQAAETYTQRMFSKDFFCQLAICFERDPNQYTQVLDNVASWQDLVKANGRMLSKLELASIWCIGFLRTISVIRGGHRS